MTRVVKLNARTVLKLQAIDGKRTDWRDDPTQKGGEEGLTVRVSPGGHRSYAVVYRFAGRVRRYTIPKGIVGKLPLAKARKIARGVRGDVSHGKDPMAVKRAEAAAARAAASSARALANRSTVEDLAKAWQEAKTWSRATRRGYERFITSEILPKIGKLAAEDVKTDDVVKFLDVIEGRSKSSAARCFEVVRAMFRWANRPGKKGKKPLTTNNPCIGLEYVHKKERGVTYSNDELRRIWAAIRGTEIEGLVPFIAYTAERSHEARAAQWAHIDFERKLWTDGERQVPLSTGALRVLKALKAKTGTGTYVFPAPTTKCHVCGQGGHLDRPGKVLAFVGEGDDPENEESDKRANLGRALHLHDLRRTVADRMRIDLEIAPYVVDFGVLGHRPSKLVRTYMPSAPIKEVRRALERWCDHLDAILAGQTKAEGNVVEFPA